MVKRLLLVKERKRDIELMKAISKEVRLIALKKHKPIRWLKFAQKQNKGYFVIANKGKQWELFIKIVTRIQTRFPKVQTGELVEMLFLLIHTTVLDYVKESGLTVDKRAQSKYKKYLQSLLIEVINTSIPRHYEFKPVSKLKNGKLKVKNIIDGKLYTVTIKQDKEFVMYEFT